MARFRLYLAVTLDGYIADENGGVDFLNSYDPSQLGYDQFAAGIDLMVQGSVTYEQTLGFGDWPYGRIPSVVMSRRQLPVPAGVDVRFHRGSAGELLSELESFQGSVWIVGGSRIIASLLEAGMRPSLELALIPQVLGRGVPLFREHDWRGSLRLAQCRTYANGVVTLHYEPREEAAAKRSAIVAP